MRWSGEGHIISSARDCSINVWSGEVRCAGPPASRPARSTGQGGLKVAGTQDGRLVHTLKGHGHWVNHLALSSEATLRTGAFDHTGAAPASAAEAQAAALERYKAAVAGRPERLASGSDDFTMFLWEPSRSSKPLQRMTGHMQLINQVRALLSFMAPAAADGRRSVESSLLPGAILAGRPTPGERVVRQVDQAVGRGEGHLCGDAAGPRRPRLPGQLVV